MKLVIVTTGLLFTSLGFSKVFDLSKTESRVEFLAIGKPSALKINGTGGKLVGQITIENLKVSGSFAVPLSTLTTGISLRDEHMKTKYLEIEKFPNAELEIQELTLPQDIFSQSVKFENLPFKGMLRIHGIAKPVMGTALIDSKPNTVSIVAKLTTNISAHEIALPSYLGIKVADEINVTSEFTLPK